MLATTTGHYPQPMLRHLHRRGCGISNAWRLWTTSATSELENDLAQQGQNGAWWTTTASGVSTIFNVLFSWPGWPTLFWAASLGRPDFFDKPSDEGDLWLVLAVQLYSGNESTVSFTTSLNFPLGWLSFYVPCFFYSISVRHGLHWCILRSCFPPLIAFK